MDAVSTSLPTLTTNRQFINDLMDCTAPCCALGFIEENQNTYPMLALRTGASISRTITDQGFNLGHAVLGNDEYEIIQFAFEFYGFGMYSVLLNPSNPQVQMVLRAMLNGGDYFILLIDAEEHVTTFKGQDDLSGFRHYVHRLTHSCTSDKHYNKALSAFKNNPEPRGGILNWVCRDNPAHLDLSRNRLEMTAEQSTKHDPLSQNADFSLPPNITVKRQARPNGVAYAFRDVELGELGRLVVEGTPSGQTRLTSEVAGDPNDPMLQRRLDMLSPLCQQLARVLGGHFDVCDAGNVALTQPRPEAAGQVPCEEVRCDTCGHMVAFLIFADEATNKGIFEDVARMMYTHYAPHNVPTYIIGPELGEGPLELRAANILQVWPERAPLECLRPDEFNPRIERLLQQHCVK